MPASDNRIIAWAVKFIYTAFTAHSSFYSDTLPNSVVAKLITIWYFEGLCDSNFTSDIYNWF